MENTVQQPAWKLLNEAAETLRRRALYVTPGPWIVAEDEPAVLRGTDNYATCGGWVEGDRIQLVAHVNRLRPVWNRDEAIDTEASRDAEYIALMHPPVALALAALFEQHAGWLAQADDDTPADAADLGDIGHVVEVARTVLRIGGAR